MEKTIEQDEGVRRSNGHDRPCDRCGLPMVGIMRYSRPPIRITCEECGGISVHHEDYGEEL